MHHNLVNLVVNLEKDSSYIDAFENANSKYNIKMYKI